MAHPVELSLKSTTDQQTRLFLMQANYGWALPAKHLIEQEMLSRVGRMGGLESSKVALEVLNNTLETIEWQDYQNVAMNREAAQPPPYVILQKQFGMLQ